MLTESAVHPVCDFCGSDDMASAYRVPTSRMGMVVAVCRRCGLVQSVPTTPRTRSGKSRSTSSDAFWGNIRHGKGLRCAAAMELLDSFVSWGDIAHILDVGSNRGDFISAIKKRRAQARITAVEPDETLVTPYLDEPGVALHLERLENVPLPEGRFDLVYCSHTLEHADSAANMLQQIGRCMKPQAYLFAEVPNIEIISAEDVVEEFFIDKHRFHFHRTVLGHFLQESGFRIVSGLDATDLSNITILAAKEHEPSPSLPLDQDLAALAGKLHRTIEDYSRKLLENRANLQHVVERLRPFLERQKVAFWGAGRIFDALVVYGGLQPEEVPCLVDQYLYRYQPVVQGLQVLSPEYLKTFQPQVVVVLARSSADDIVAAVRRLGIRNAIRFTDLFYAAG